MLMRNFSCCGARCIVRALAMLSARCSCAEPKKSTEWPPLLLSATYQLPEDEDEMPSVVSRGDLMRLARDASALFGQSTEESGSEMHHMRAPSQAPRPRLDDEGQ